MALVSAENPIFYYRNVTWWKISGTTAAEILATGSPWGLIRNAMEADPEIRIQIREIRIFRKFFFAFFAFTDILGPQGHPPGCSSTT